MLTPATSSASRCFHISRDFGLLVAGRHIASRCGRLHGESRAATARGLPGRCSRPTRIPFCPIACKFRLSAQLIWIFRACGSSFAPQDCHLTSSLSLSMQLCQRVQRDSSKFSFVQEFPQEHGMITIGRQSFDPNSAAAFLPQDVPSNLGRALTVVPEAGDEGDDLEEHLANSGAQQQPISDGDASIAATLEGFGAQGLLPRPGTCSQLLSFIDSTAITAVHLDQVPFLVRSARLDDAVALHRLQGHLPTKMLRRRMPLAEIRDIINTGEGHWQWVAEVQGTVVAAIMLEHSKSDALGGVDAALKFHLIAMHPALDERAEIFYAIANFALQCILVDGEVQELRQGNLRIDLGFGDAGPEAVLAKFQTVAHTGKSERVHYNKPDKILQVKSGRCLPSAFSGVAHREILFGSWISLDGLVSWVASQVSSGSVSLTPNRANDAELNDLSAMPANAVALGDSIDRRRSKLSLIVEEARRLTSTADFNDAGIHMLLKQ